MNGELAQLIALVAHGNAYLGAAPDADAPALDSAFSFVASLRFARYTAPGDENPIIVARDAAAWLNWLRARHTRRLWVVAPDWTRDDLAERIAVAFSGAAPQAIQADAPDGYELWCPLWQVVKRDEKPWAVEYGGLMAAHSHAPQLPNLGAAQDDLRRALGQTLDFVSRADIAYTNWQAVFDGALQALDNPNPPASNSLPRAGFGLQARQLLASATRAYVFGGMGSWNDLGWQEAELNDEYNRVSGALYAAVKAAILAAANGYQER